MVPPQTDPRDAEHGRKLLQEISEAAERATRIGRQNPIAVNVNASDAKDIARALGLPSGATINRGTYKGLTIYVDPSMGAIGPQLIMGDSTGTFVPRGGPVDRDPPLSKPFGPNPSVPSGGFAQGGIVANPHTQDDYLGGPNGLPGKVSIAPLGPDGKPCGPFTDLGHVKDFKIKLNAKMEKDNFYSSTVRRLMDKYAYGVPPRRYATLKPDEGNSLYKQVKRALVSGESLPEGCSAEYDSEHGLIRIDGIDFAAGPDEMAHVINGDLVEGTQIHQIIEDEIDIDGNTISRKLTSESVRRFMRGDKE